MSVEHIKSEIEAAGDAFLSSTDMLAEVADGTGSDDLASAQQLTHEGWKLCVNNAKRAADMESEVHKRANRQLVALINTASYLRDKVHTAQNDQTQAKSAVSEAVEISTDYSEGL